MENLAVIGDSTCNRAASICVARVKTNITLKIDSGILREIKVLAAETGGSVSSLVSSKLEEIVRERKGYSRSKKSAIARLRAGF